MIPLLEQYHEQLRDLCLRHGVARLEVFGSAARGDFDASHSDLDFLVEFQSLPDVDRFTQYFAFKEALEFQFGHSVDLVMLGALRNPFFIRDVNESRVLLYAA